MIVEWFVDFTLGLFAAVLGFIPFPETLDLSALAPVFGVMGTFNGLAPVTEALAASALVLSVTAALFVYRAFKVAISHIPWIGGAG